MVFRAYGPWARPPCFLLEAWPEGRYLQTSRRRSQCPACNKQYRESPHRERCRDFSKAQRSKRKEHIWGEAYIFRYLSSSKWRYGNRVRIMMADQEQNAQPHFKAHGYSKIVPQQQESLNPTHPVGFLPVFFLFSSPLPMQWKKILAPGKAVFLITLKQ